MTPARAASAPSTRSGGQSAPARQPTFVNVQVSHDTYLAHSEPAIAENPRNHNNLIAGSKQFTDPQHYQFKIGTYYSMDGGRTWHDNGFLPGFQDYGTTSDVSIAFSSKGVAYVCVLALADATLGQYKSGIFVLSSTDGGKTFSKPVPVFLDTSGATFSDKPWIAVDDTKGHTAGNIYVAWNLDSNRDANGGGDPDKPLADNQTSGPSTDASPVGMVISHSSDGGKTFSPPLSLVGFDQQFYIGAMPQVGPGGQVSVVFGAVDSHSGLVTAIDIATSRDGGATFSAPRPIVSGLAGLPNHLKNGTFRNLTLPSLAVSPADGSMVVVWSDMRYGNADIWASHSMDGGATWSAAVRVNHDHVGNGKDHFQPVVAVAQNGNYTCAWFDRRYDPHNRLIDEVVAQSLDDGATFGHNFRVTKRSWNPAIGAPQPEGKPSNTFIGDYQALAVDNTTVHPLWNDTQNGKGQEIHTAVVPERTFALR